MTEDGALAIRRAMGRAGTGVGVTALDTVDSTNTRLKEAVRAGRVSPPYLLTADGQTAGRGRLGRAFVSPPGTGLYMSLLVTPPPGMEAGKITILAAVAVCLAIEELTPLRPKIKWVNDLFVGGRKVCGILAEGVGPDVIVGIGVNLREPPGGFPQEAGPAGALNADVDRFTLAGTIARHFLEGLSRLDAPDTLAAYRARMPLAGHTVTYTQNGQQKNARVTGVAEDGGLIVQDEAGAHVLRTGEVSLGSQAFSGLL